MTFPLPNEFITSGDDNKLRPWTAGVEEHNDPLATIVLFTDSGASPNLESSNPKDYINNLSLSVQSIISESVNNISAGLPDAPVSEITAGAYTDKYGNRVNGQSVPGGKIPVFKLDGKNDYYGVFNNFSLLSFAESHDQIVKIHMNFSASWNAFFFGGSPNIYQFKGYFIDSANYPYYQEFMVAYDKYLSGRKAVENRIQTKLMVAGQIIDGYLLNVNVTHNANTVTLKEFQFTMLVKGISWIRSNVIYSPSLDWVVREYNGLSNINRLNRQLIGGLIETNSSNDSSGKTIRTGMIRSTK